MTKELDRLYKRFNRLKNKRDNLEVNLSFCIGNIIDTTNKIEELESRHRNKELPMRA